MVLWVGQAGLSWVILLLYVALTEATHWNSSALRSDLEGPKWRCSTVWVVRRPGPVAPRSLRGVGASSGGLSAGVAGLL